MKQILTTLLCLFAFALTAEAQHPKNNNGDSIIGNYMSDRGGSKSKIRVTKNANGTYNAQLYWVENPTDKNGNKRKDEKNPDKALRNVDIDKVVIVEGLQYEADKKRWGGAKMYDPTKGLKVNATAEFESADKLKLRGTILGVGVTLYWTRIEE